MIRPQSPLLFLLTAGLSLTATTASANCTNNTLGTGNHKVCAVLGNPCESKTGSCLTVIIPKENTQGGDCVCQPPKSLPDDSTFFLNPTGPLPTANGHATVRWLPDGRRAAAIGVRGLQPGIIYQAFLHVGATGNCSGGNLLPLGPSFVANGLGDGVVIEESQLWPISVREAGGLARTVLCGAPPVTASAPAVNPWTSAAMAMVLPAIAAIALLRRNSRTWRPDTRAQGT